ncbi:MAG: metalloregulator ArsR/SmtB family transcription factor [Bacteroidales bacterium]|nr:metalloregulator ArsR/SmtB family transcription factor [Bacteroidales bacterium]MCF8327495.1 metalloregulator ArsR/SmtB family transcription factor [Bacteroidales bacterium]
METTKSGLDIVKLEDAASKLRSIAHPMRIAIISLLEDQPKMNVTEIYEQLKIEQASASHHLNILKNKGILQARRDGKNTYYSLKQQSIAQIIECVQKCEEIR